MGFKKYTYLAAAVSLGLVVVLAADPAHAQTLGGVINRVRNNGISLRFLFGPASYLIGALLGVLAIKKLKDHVENPNHVPLADPAKRAVASGAFLALPFMINVARTTITGTTNVPVYAGTGFSGTADTTDGLDGMIVSLMNDVFAPLQWLFGSFGYIAGIVLLMIGISRLLKSEQDGPRGPAGIGTIITFLSAGLLFSLNPLIMYITGSIFGLDSIQTNTTLAYSDDLEGAAHIHSVLSAIIMFSIILGWVSLIRGIFILRGVSEGNSQASMMAAITHLIGGVLAINLGPLVRTVQNTLGITDFGITVA